MKNFSLPELKDATNNFSPGMFLTFLQHIIYAYYVLLGFFMSIFSQITNYEKVMQLLIYMLVICKLNRTKRVITHFSSTTEIGKSTFRLLIIYIILF